MARKGLLEKIAAFYHQLEEERIKQDRQYLKEQLGERKPVVCQEIKSLRELTADCKEHSEIHQLVKTVGQELAVIDEIEEQLDEKFSIFVIGNGNSGKSTLVNALAGQKAAEVSAIPKTWKVDVFYGEAEEAGNLRTHEESGAVGRQPGCVEVIRQIQGVREKQVLKADEARILIENEDIKRMVSLEVAEAILDNKMLQIEALAKQKNLTPTQKLALEMQYREKLYQEKLYISPVTEVRWPLARRGLLKHFQIVDTPGLTQDLNGVMLSDSMKDYYRQADGILCVLDMNKIADESVIKLIDKAEAALQQEGIDSSSQPVLGILNRWDLIREPKEAERLRQQAESLYDGYFNEVLPLSAKKAMEGRLQEDQALIESSGYQAVEDYINEHFLYESSTRKMAKRLQLLYIQQSRLKEAVAAYKEVLEEREAQREKLQVMLKQDIEQLTELTHQRINALITAYKEQVEERIEEWVPKLFESSFNKEQKIEHAVFEMARLNEMIQDLVQSFNAEISQAEEIYREQIEMQEETGVANELSSEEKIITTHDVQLKLEDMKLSTLLEQGWLQFLNKYKIVKTLLKITRSEACRKELNTHLQDMTQILEEELNEALTGAVKNLERRMEQLREESFSQCYGRSEGLDRQLQILNKLETLFGQPFKEKTITDYIK